MPEPRHTTFHNGPIALGILLGDCCFHVPRATPQPWRVLRWHVSVVYLFLTEHCMAMPDPEVV